MCEAIVRCSVCGQERPGELIHGQAIVGKHEAPCDDGDCPGSGVPGTLVGETDMETAEVQP